MPYKKTELDERNGLTGEEVKEIREKYGLTQQEFGEQLGLTKRQVWSLEHNKVNKILVSERIRATEFTRARRANGISGEQVAKKRKELGLTQEEFGQKIGFTKRQIWSMEHRKRNTKKVRERIRDMSKPDEDIVLSGEQVKLIRSLTELSQFKFGEAIGRKQSGVDVIEHRKENSVEVTRQIRDAFPDEFLWVSEHFELKRRKPDPVPVQDVYSLTGVQIRKIRKLTGLNQVSFGERLGKSQTRIAKLEHQTGCSKETECQIAELFPDEYRHVTGRNVENNVVITGKQLKKIRLLTGLSQASFAVRIGLSQSWVNYIEHHESTDRGLRIREAFPEEYALVVLSEKAEKRNYLRPGMVSGKRPPLIIPGFVLYRRDPEMIAATGKN